MKGYEDLHAEELDGLEAEFKKAEADKLKKKEWKKKAYTCERRREGHSWMPISKITTKTAEHVSMIMCGHCFHFVNIPDVSQLTLEQISEVLAEQTFDRPL